MNKKFSTLVAALLMGTAFYAGAQDADRVNGEDLKDGGTYFLGATDANAPEVLMQDGDSLVMRAWATVSDEIKQIQEMSKAEREFAMWTVSIKTQQGGTKAYEFVNKATGKKLQLPTNGKAYAYVTNGMSQYGWAYTAGDATPVALQSTLANGEVKGLQTVYELQEDLVITTPAVDFANLTKGFKSIQVVNFATAPTLPVANTITGLTFSNTVTEAQITSAKEAVKDAKDALIAAGFDYVNDKRIADLRTFETQVNALTTSSTAAPAKQTDAGAVLTAMQAALSPYGIEKADKDGKISGVVHSDNGTGIAAVSTTYKKGTKFIMGDDPMAFNAAEIGMLPVGGATVIDAAVIDKKDEALTIGKFVTEFNTGNQDAKDVVVKLGFDGSNSTDINVLAGKDLQVVKRNLLIDAATGLAQGSATLAKGDFKAATLIMDKATGKYLVVKTETRATNSTYFVLDWAGLKDLTSFIGSTPAGVKYYNGNGNLAASYVFDVTYFASKDSLVIKPEFIVEKNEYTTATDTAGVTYTITENAKAAGTNDYLLSLKEFRPTMALTVVDAATASNETIYRINTSGSAPASGWEATTKDSDVYFIQFLSDLATNSESNKNFFIANLAGEQALVKDSADFNHIPAAQWVVKKEDNDLVSIYNRETKTPLTTNSKVFENIQLYKAGGENVCLLNGDTLKLTPVATAFVGDSANGYFAHDKANWSVEKRQLAYLHKYAIKNVGLNIADSMLVVDNEGEGIWFTVAPKAGAVAQDYGYTLANVAKQLKRTTYNLVTRIDGEDYKVSYKNGKFGIWETGATVADFYVKEQTCVDNTPYYVLVIANTNITENKVSVDDQTLNLFAELFTEERTSLFALNGEPAPLYRRLGETVADDGIAKNDTAYVEFYMANEPSRFLYENSSNIVANNGTNVSADSLNFLGVLNKFEMTRNFSIFVDTAYVRDNTNRPQYMLALGVTRHQGMECPFDPEHNSQEYIDENGYCAHAKQTTPYNAGRYLVSLTDSADNKSAIYEAQTRLAFVDAKHIEDTLVINSSKFKGVEGKADLDSIEFSNDNLTAATYAFRLADDVTDGSFYIETEVKGVTKYVRIHNGVPVLTGELVKAAIFNVNPTEETPTSNEGVSTSEVSVIAANGAVIVNGAAGKKVVITNVLGQTIANTVLSSDNATISAPAGLMVVAVEGETAVKAIVK